VSGLVERVVDLCRALRERGCRVTSAHAADAIRALQAVRVDRRDRAHAALRCVLASRPEEFALFDELFDRIFFAPAAPASRSRVRTPQRTQPRDTAEAVSRAFSSWGGAANASDVESEEVPGASADAGNAKKDFATFGSAELAEIERIVAGIARRLSLKPGRRWTPAHAGARVDLRRTLRGASAGELIDLRFRTRKPRRTRIVALCDVSGSMDLYSRLLLQFLYALQGAAARVESFVFSTELRRTTDILRAPHYAAALRAVAAEVHDFSGGTRIGECLARFNADFRRLVDRRTVVLILSDGWDTGDPELLAAALDDLQRRCRRLVWLNPLLGSPGYQPLAIGMRAALPHVGVFAPAHNLASLRALERHLA
jgi:uncharacterized protein with von Willebrand factor type A (vWA) domain